jgi:hypothetical protein
MDMVLVNKYISNKFHNQYSATLMQFNFSLVTMK